MLEIEWRGIDASDRRLGVIIAAQSQTLLDDRVEHAPHGYGRRYIGFVFIKMGFSVSLSQPLKIQRSTKQFM
jgi:hypothetical protein